MARSGEQLGAGREGRVEREEEDGLNDSSGFPQRFMGTIGVIFSLSWAIASLSRDILPKGRAPGGGVGAT